MSANEMLKFVAAAVKATENRSRGEIVNFPCPNCGIKATAYKAKCSGRVSAHCQHCGLVVRD